jgi:hypothetical protein
VWGYRCELFVQYFEIGEVYPVQRGAPIANLLLFERVPKIAKSDYFLRNVCLSVSMQQLGSHWTDFHEILYFLIF